MASEICPGCKKPQPNVGPWNEPGCPHRRLCGGCKARWTLGDPRRRARLAHDIGAFAKAVTGAESVSVEFPQFDGPLKS